MPAPVSAGDMLAGKYRVERVLGEGGMGVVVAATDVQLERKVAIKFLLPEYAQHHEASQRFVREARAAVKIHSEHVARIIDVATMDGGIPYMVMEYLQGGDLASVIEEAKPIPVEDAIGFVLEACEAIAEAHSVGIVHRDLKPANLFLARQPDGSSKIKVLDFGISKAMVTTTTDHSLTRTSSLMGSPLYMSPEQMKSAKNVDPRTDIWALGVILYELLTLEPPFDAESIPELSAKVLLDEIVPIRGRRSDVPEGLDAVVKHALAKDPAARFPNVAAFAQALLPFGPARCRVNVDRASRVLQIAAGPASASLAGTVPGAPPVYARTEAAWTESSDQKAGPPAKRRAPVVFAVATLVAFTLFGAFIFGTRRNADDAASHASATVTGLTPTAEPARAAATATAAAPVAAENQEAPSASAAPSAAPAVVPSVTPPAPSVSAHPVPVPRVAAHPRVQQKPPAPAPAPAADPFGGFGSRK